MRTIKFRGKRAKGECVGEWAYGELIQHDNLIWLEECDCIGMFTGCLDANGKEIYEGDILKVKDYEITDEKITYIVDYNDSGFILRNALFRGKYTSLNQPYSECLVVVGNIYDNPELLNK